MHVLVVTLLRQRGDSFNRAVVCYFVRDQSFSFQAFIFWQARLEAFQANTIAVSKETSHYL